MSLQATIKASAPVTVEPSLAARLSAFMRFAMWTAAAVCLFAAIWYVIRFRPYDSGRDIGYALGLTGGTMTLGLLLYPMRKRLRIMQDWGALKYWFRFHMIGGIAGPLLVMFHSTFQIGSPNAAVALVCMLLVVGSGLVGRFLYRQIHRGLYGSQLTLKELQQDLEKNLDALEPQLQWSPEIRAGLRGFMAYAAAPASGWTTSAKRFCLIGGKRRATLRCIAAAFDTAGANGPRLLPVVDSTLRAAQQAAQLSAYERLFSLWHIVHIPFLCMLAITAVIHVVAVHVY